MPAKQASVLIVEDVVSLAMTYRSYLKAENVAIEVVGDGQAALDAVANNPPNAIILDINLPDISGMDILQTLREKGLDIPVIMITGDGSIQTAVETMRRGAFDFIVKPFTADRLRVTLRNALTQHKLKEQVNELKQSFAAEGFADFIGNSLTMQSVYQILRSAAQSNATVFVTGESGTGKELCAEALHKMSKRADKPLVAINCASIPPGLLESEIFGHVKGAFTGATTDRLGAVLSADGGTLFLDEIGEMQPEFQSKLLRFLETGQVQRVGEDKLRKSNVRIVCATNRDPRHEVAEGRFREDLFYRLHVIPVEMNGSDDPANGLLLSKDVHWSFDEGLIWVDEDRRLAVADDVSAYDGNEFLTSLKGRQIREARSPRCRVHDDALGRFYAKAMAAFKNGWQL